MSRLGRYLLERAWPLFRLAVRMVLSAVLAAAPFLAVIGAIYYVFLTEFDINYYLAEHPPVFLWSIAAAGLILLAMVWVLLRVFASWVMALPLVLIERAAPAAALAASRNLTRDIRWPVALVLLAWAAINAGLLTLSGLLLDQGADLVLMLSGDSLTRMAYLMGGLLLLWSLINLGITLFGNAVLVLLVLRLYRRMFPDSRGAGLERLMPRRIARSIKVSGGLILAGFLLVAVGAGLVLNRMAKKLGAGGDPLVIAHRGASFDAPENTLAAVEEAIRQGADYVEIDVQETAEGNIVVIHDRDLMKVGGSPLRVWEAPLRELQSVDVGSWANPKFSDQRVPTLPELLTLCRDRVRVNIELKYYGREQRFEERVVQIVRDMRMEDQVVVMSLSPDGLAKLRQLAPDWRIGLLSSVALGDISRLGLDFYAVNGRFATRSFVRSVHRRRGQVLVWTINDPVQMAAMMGKNVDGIITDLPGLAVDVLAQRTELQPYERFMLQFAALLGGQIGSEQ
jgi:glycerophosphoryl diester phosphodiesterase